MLSGLSRCASDWLFFEAMGQAQRDDLRAKFASAAPFPHLVIDGLFPADRLHAATQDFEAAPAATWRRIQSGMQTKRATLPDSPLPASVQDYFNHVNSGPFIRFLSDITGVANLIPDPALHGGGMHEVGEGGAFEIHIDFEQHPRTFLNNRLVVITYLNDEWQPADGGDLELWDTKPARCAASITPIFGRTVIMQQSRVSAHGHPRPIRAGRKRRSITAYFYTNGRVPGTAGDRLPTVYVPHKGHSIRQRMELFLHLFVPPIILMGLRPFKTMALNTIMRMH
jgi:hypothetical protein